MVIRANKEGLATKGITRCSLLLLPLSHPGWTNQGRYLGVEHRIKSIHVDIFTYQLQKTTGRGVSWGQGERKGETLCILVGKSREDSSNKEGAWAGLEATEKSERLGALTAAQTGAQRTRVTWDLWVL